MSRSLAVEVSVVVATSGTVAGLTRCLDSLLDQSSAPPYEIVVVSYGRDTMTEWVVRAAGRRSPDVPVRFVRTGAGTRAGAQNAGAAVAEGRWLVFVHDEDRVAADYLAGLLGDDLTDPQEGLRWPLRLVDDGPLEMDVSGALRKQTVVAGRTVRARELAADRLVAALRIPVGWAISADLFARYPFDADLHIGEGSVLLARLFRDDACELTFRSEATYYRCRESAHDGLDASRLLMGAQRVAVLLNKAADSSIRSVLIASLADDVARFLRRHPDKHPEVLRERRRRRLTGVVDPRVLNSGVARDLAILWVAPPYVDTSANVAARRVLTRRVVVDVVSNNVSSRLATDDLSGLIWAEYVDRQVVVRAPVSDTWWPGVNRFCRMGMARIARLERTKGPYRSVYSRAMHPTSHFLAAWYKAQRPTVSWLAEYSDPIRLDILGRHRQSTGVLDKALMADFAAILTSRGFAVPDTDNLFHWVETLGFALADEITFTNEHQRTFMLENYPDSSIAERAREHSVVAAHPVPESWLYHLSHSPYELPADVVNLTYFGVFYATRGLSEVWEALRRLPAAQRGRIRLHVFTSKPDDLKVALRDAGLDDLVEANAYVSYPEFLNIAARADVLVVNDAQTKQVHSINPYLPSKWSDYRGSGSLVWGIVEPDSVLSRQALDLRSELGDVDGALTVLNRLIGRPPRGVAGRESIDLTVLVATHDRPDTLPRTLAALGAQTLDHGRFEVVVIANGPRDHVPEQIDTARRQHPTLQVRLIESSVPGAARARNAGLAAARGRLVTVVDDDDWVSANYLAGLLDAMAPGVVPLAVLADVTGEDLEPTFDTYVGRAIGPLRGKTVAVLTAHQGISVNVGKVIPTAWAREVGFNESLSSGEDFVFWTSVFVRHPFRFAVVEDPDVVYYRDATGSSMTRRSASFDFAVTQRVACIRALDEIEPSSNAAEELIRRMIGGQIGFIRRYVEAHPDEIAAVEQAYADAAIGRWPINGLNLRPADQSASSARTASS